MPQVWRQSPSAVGEYVLFTDVAQVLTKKSRNCASSAQGSAPNVLIDAISLLLGLAGIIAGRVAVTRWAAQKWLRDPHAYWFTGLITLAPAWLIAFVTLLPTSPGARPQLTSGGLWILSASAALIGTITTEARVRSAESGRQLEPVTLWGLGVLGFIPAWVLAMIGHALG